MHILSVSFVQKAKAPFGHAQCWFTRVFSSIPVRYPRFVDSITSIFRSKSLPSWNTLKTCIRQLHLRTQVFVFTKKVHIRHRRLVVPTPVPTQAREISACSALQALESIAKALVHNEDLSP